MPTLPGGSGSGDGNPPGQDVPTDSDGDGVADEVDLCAQTPMGVPVDAVGCPVVVPPGDADGDGVNDDIDQCIETLAGAVVDAAGCAVNQRDSDGDGVTDDLDQCPGTAPNASTNAAGCADGQVESPDLDGDGVASANDLCPGTRPGAVVDANGCASDQRDSDHDGVPDNRDRCPGTLEESQVNASGCAASQRDSDGDGVTDDLDECADTIAGEQVDLYGCSTAQRDSDGDGVNDRLDACPDTTSGQIVDATGCSTTQKPPAGGGGGGGATGGGGPPPPECTNNQACDDHNGCTTDVCTAGGTCSRTTIPGCVTCDIPPTCPPVDVVFIMDTSGSMTDEAVALCAGIDQVVADLSAAGFDVSASMLGITETRGGAFSCLTDDVVTMLGGSIPGDADSCDFPNVISSFESWGPATAIVAERFPWRMGTRRVIVPISDEGPCKGSLPDGCNDPGDDRESIDNAIAIANLHQIIVSPITGTGSDSCVLTLAGDIAAATGGIAFASTDPRADLTSAIAVLVENTCIPNPCDDGNGCTLNDLCIQGVCSGPSTPGCVPCAAIEDCDDHNACTIDLCRNGICMYRNDYHTATECCNPADHTLTLLDDSDPCTGDVCNAKTGVVGRNPLTGNACDDGLVCTVDDACLAGQCTGTDVNSLTCTINTNCPAGNCDLGTHQCHCSEGLPICVDPIPKVCSSSEQPCLTDADCPSQSGVCVCEDFMDPDCVDDGQTVNVAIHVDAGPRIIAGGQFLLRYDPTCLDFVSIGPCQGDTIFTQVLNLSVDEVAGKIFYAVFANLDLRAIQITSGPYDLACLSFTRTGTCSGVDICFLDENPKLTILTDEQGNRIPLDRCDCGASTP